MPWWTASSKHHIPSACSALLHLELCIQLLLLIENIHVLGQIHATQCRFHIMLTPFPCLFAVRSTLCHSRDTEGSCLQSRPPSIQFKPQSQIGNHLLWFLVYFPAMKISGDSWFPSLCFFFFKHKDNLFYSFSPYSFHLQYIFETLPKYTENSCSVISFSLHSIPVCVRVHKILASLKLMDARIIPNL